MPRTTAALDALRAIAIPVPTPEGMPPAVGGIILLIGVATVALLVWQAVRFFRGSDRR